MLDLSPDHVLDQITQRIALGSIADLDDCDFLRAHRCFEGRSDQQRQILAWFARWTRQGDWLKPIDADEVAPDEAGSAKSVLSIGCGSGILDMPLAEILQEPRRGRRLTYWGVDPNRPECDLFESTFAKAQLPGVTGHAETIGIDQYNPDRQFDLILVAHVLYYLDDPQKTIRSCLQWLKPGGSLVIIHAPFEPLNALVDPFWKRLLSHDIWYEDEVTSELAELDVVVEQHAIRAHVDITHCLDQSHLNSDWLDLLNFLVQADLGQSDPRLTELVTAYVEHLAIEDRGRTLLPHPATLFEIRQGRS